MPPFAAAFQFWQTQPDSAASQVPLELNAVLLFLKSFCSLRCSILNVLIPQTLERRLAQFFKRSGLPISCAPRLVPPPPVRGCWPPCKLPFDRTTMLQGGCR